MSTPQKVLIGILAAILALVAFRLAYGPERDWKARAGRTVLQSEFVRHPLAKDLCVMVTRDGAIAQVDCRKVGHLLVNPAPPELPGDAGTETPRR